MMTDRVTACSVSDLAHLAELVFVEERVRPGSLLRMPASSLTGDGARPVSAKDLFLLLLTLFLRGLVILAHDGDMSARRLVLDDVEACTVHMVTERMARFGVCVRLQNISGPDNARTTTTAEAMLDLARQMDALPDQGELHRDYAVRLPVAGSLLQLSFELIF
jgi:hypothetical protein